MTPRDETGSGQRATYYQFGYDAKGLRGKRLRLLSDVPTDDAGVPQDLPVGGTDVISTEDGVGPNLSVRVYPPGSPENIAYVAFDQLALYDEVTEPSTETRPLDDNQNELHPIAVSDPLLAPPDALTEPLIDPQLDLLPTHQMRWEDFERLLLRVARDVEGLHPLMLFGTRGQAQGGLDVVGINPERQPEGIQSKRWQKFTESDLDAAVSKYTRSTLSFTIVKLAVGVATPAHSREIVERLIELNVALKPLVIEIWDQTRLSEILRSHPQIVMEFFGPATASKFCMPHKIATVEVANKDAVATADAILRGPLAAAGAEAKLKQAKELANSEPEQALALYLEIQQLLNAKGFPAHAASFDQQVMPLLARLGREDEAIHLITERLWRAERADDHIGAEHAVLTIEALASKDMSPPEGGGKGIPGPLKHALEIAEFVALHLTQPVPQLLDLPGEALVYLSPEDRARTILFAAERALGDDNHEWIDERKGLILNAANEVAASDDEVSVRLRLAVADVTGDWHNLVRQARTGSIRRDISALTLARYARYRATQGEFADADEAWSEAVEKACLSHRHEDAGDWIYSQRFVVNRYQLVTEDKWHPLAQSLSALASKPRIATSANRAREHALAALHHEKPRVAAISLRRYLCDAIRSGSINDEIDARRLLGDVYAASGQPALATDHLIRAAHVESARSVGEALGDTYLDVSKFMASPVYWVVATALEFAATQADVIPDDKVNSVVARALDAIKGVEAGTQVDSPLYSPHLYLSAYTLIAALADRLTIDDAQAVLALLEDSVSRKAEQRQTDESHILIAAAIARRHPGIRADALRHLVVLFERQPYMFRPPAGEVLRDNLELIGAQLREMAQGTNIYAAYAAGLLAEADVDKVPPGDAAAAAERLRQPTSNTEGSYKIGSRAIADSLLARALPARDRAACIRMLLTNANSPYEGAENRISYLLAAVNLSSNLEEEERSEFFRTALNLATENPRSDLDALHAQMADPLGFMRRTGSQDSRQAAAYLAAMLARSDQDKRTVRDAAIKLIGADDDQDYYVTKALQVLQSELADIAPLLAHFGWALRSLAAISWAESSSMPADLGEKLSRDPDARVRRALAQGIRKSDAPHTNVVREALKSDPRWSVRSILLPE